MSTNIVEQLKREGDYFFRLSDYKNGSKNFTKALKIGGDSTMLYLNRSACRSKLGQYVVVSFGYISLFYLSGRVYTDSLHPTEEEYVKKPTQGG
ncbi:hypothetical protein GYMLUDRAFT_960691 [Collybiopsis luxurians FD-317 M1]|nr:hypothetical protein GYMLUDRAFT_960691 [Collybiopsis luxurians FD-317 M1]